MQQKDFFNHSQFPIPKKRLTLGFILALQCTPKKFSLIKVFSNLVRAEKLINKNNLICKISNLICLIQPTWLQTTRPLFQSGP